MCFFSDLFSDAAIPFHAVYHLLIDHMEAKSPAILPIFFPIHSQKDEGPYNGHLLN
jgi:hypothetical protein